MNTLRSGVGKTVSWGQLLPNAPTIDDDGCVNHVDLALNLGKILRNEGVAGAVIEGERGSGKRHAIETAVSREAYAGTVYRLAGTRYGQEIEFGALHFLLFDLQDDQIVSPIIVFSELRKCFEGGPSKPLFIIENLTFMDQWSITVLSQLVQAGLIRIFVIDDKETSLNEDIHALVRSEALQHWRVLPLTFTETENRINASTGLSPSPLATATLWTYSEGNAEWLDAVMDDGLEQGSLIRSTDSLLIATDGIVAGRRMLEVARSWLDRLSPVQRQVMEIVACDGIIPPRQLEPEQLAEIDPLYERGLLEYVREPAAGVRLASRVLGNCLRNMLAVGRRVGHGRRPEIQIHFNTASVSSATLDSQQLSSTGFEQYVRDMVQAGRGKQALLRVSQERSRSFGNLPDGLSDHSGPCELTGDGLNVLSLELRLALQTGDLALIGLLIPVIDSARSGFRLHHASSHELHAAAATLLEALARCNRDAETAELITWLTEVCLQRIIQGTELETEPCFPRTIRSFLAAFLTLGEWDSCRDLAAWVLNSQLRDPHVIAFANIVEGILAAVAGDCETARTRLVPVERQLSLTGPPEDHRAIAGILAYCQITTGFSADAARILPPDATAAARSTCFGWVAQFFWIAAVSKTYSPDSGRLRLLALLDDKANQKGSMFRLHALAHLLRMGDLNAASELQEACHGNRSIFAEAYGLLARGVLDKSSAPIVRGLQMLTDFGFAEYAAEPENHLHRLISPSQRRMIARSRSLHRRSIAVGAEEQEGTLDQVGVFDLLTKRERFVAAAAARGLSNLEIADKASVSVRTVEGHLYQVYSKLTIQGRSELHSLAASLLRKPADSHV